MNYEITNPLGSKASSLTDVFNFLVQNIIVVMIPIAALLYVYAGIMYLNAGRDPSSLQKAKQILTYTTVGLVIILIGGGFVDLIRSILSAASGSK